MTIQIVAPGIYRGSAPIELRDYAYLMSLGIKYILDLETGAHLLGDGSPLADALLAEKYGLRTYSHPLGEILPPTQKELNDAVRFIVDHQPVFVHCKAGVDRTGIVIADYKVGNMRLSYPEAIADMKAHGMHWWYYWWAWFL